MSPTGIVGIEPTTPRLTVVCYYHLSYIPRASTVRLELTPLLAKSVLPLNYVLMQSGGSLDGCHYRTDATCKTVANKGISFFNVILGPCTPPHGSHNPPTTYSKNLWRVQLFIALPRMYVVIAVLRLYYIPLRLTKHDGSIGYGSRTSVIRSFSEVSPAA